MISVLHCQPSTSTPITTTAPHHHRDHRPQRNPPGSRSFVFKYVLSCAASTVAESVTYPLDIVKTRLQIQGESNGASNGSRTGSNGVKSRQNVGTQTQAKANYSTKGNGSIRAVQYRGTMRTLIGIVQEEGVLSLYGGLLPAIYRHYLYTGIRMSVYEYLRESVLKRNPDGTFALWKAMIGGMTAGFIAQLVSSPTDLIKVQMQMEGIRRIQGHPPRVHGMLHAGRSIVADGGVRQLWKGWLPNCQRSALVNMADIATYDQVKHYLLRRWHMDDDWKLHSCSSLCSSLAAAVTSTPADVVKTRIMNQEYTNGRPHLYTSSVDCLLKTVRAEGFFALYKGFMPIYARMAPWSLTFWVAFEKIRQLTGASSF